MSQAGRHCQRRPGPSEDGPSRVAGWGVVVGNECASVTLGEQGGKEATEGTGKQGPNTGRRCVVKKPREGPPLAAETLNLNDTEVSMAPERG